MLLKCLYIYIYIYIYIYRVSPQFIICPFASVFNISVVFSMFQYSCVLFNICSAYADYGLFYVCFVIGESGF